MLSAFYGSLIYDSQVFILETLGLLERDYRGEFREESMVSVEMIASVAKEDKDENNEIAWAHIIRDLEDVGVCYTTECDGVS
jgi:hypothetical protein